MVVRHYLRLQLQLFKNKMDNARITLTLRRVHELLLPWKSDKYYIFVRAGMHMCMCVSWHVHVALLIQRATHMHHIVMSVVAPLAPPYFSALPHKQHDFRNNFIEHKMCVLIFSTPSV
jgi:hypothetical protein